MLMRLLTCKFTAPNCETIKTKHQFFGSTFQVVPPKTPEDWFHRPSPHFFIFRFYPRSPEIEKPAVS